MARYRVLRKAYVGGVLREPGEEVEHDGPAGSALRALDPAQPGDAAPSADTSPAAPPVRSRKGGDGGRGAT